MQMPAARMIVLGNPAVGTSCCTILTAGRALRAQSRAGRRRGGLLSYGGRRSQGLIVFSLSLFGLTAKVRLEWPGKPGSDEPGGLWRARQWRVRTHIGQLRGPACR